MSGPSETANMNANLLTSLFKWKPTETKTPAENFLVEAFVYTLKVNADFCQAWLTRILGQPVDHSGLDIKTRVTHIDDERATSIYPDIDISGVLADGQPFWLLVEAKWGASYDLQQIYKYARIRRELLSPTIAFVGANAVECHNAQHDYQTGKLGKPSEIAAFTALQWSEVHSILRDHSANCRASRELEEFMREQGLSALEPISASLLTHYLETRNFVRRLQRYCEKLLREFPWEFLPGLYKSDQLKSVKDQYGRVAIVFARPGWNGTMTIGFLYSNHDHKVKFADGSDNSVDLMMRIEADPKAVGREEVIDVLRRKCESVRGAGGVVRLAGDVGNSNRHTLLIAQRSLAEFLGPETEFDQLERIYDQIRQWVRALFDDEVEGALAKWNSEPE